MKDHGLENEKLTSRNQSQLSLSKSTVLWHQGSGKWMDVGDTPKRKHRDPSTTDVKLSQQQPQQPGDRAERRLHPGSCACVSVSASLV